MKISLPLICLLFLPGVAFAQEKPGSASLPVAGGDVRASAESSAELRAFTGAPARVVWIQDAGDAACVFSERPTLRLMGLDAEDGKGERAILPEIARYARPLISADGQRVYFGDLEKRTVHSVNWDGTGLRTLVKNAEFADVWTDPADGMEWVYVKAPEMRGDKELPVIRRHRADKPEIAELIWDKNEAHNFMLGGDGRTASGGAGEGGCASQGLFTLPNGGFFQRGNGCWPSIAPDNSNRMWVFSGSHRSVHMGYPVTSQRVGHGATFPVEYENVPGLNFKGPFQGKPELYHPRWSNDQRYLNLTGPYTEWKWKDSAKIPMHVANTVEVYVGKFDDDFKKVERWVQVTHNKHGDYYPDTWIKPQTSVPTWYTAAPVEEPTADPADAKAKLDVTGQVFLWETGNSSNQIVDPRTGAIRQCTGKLRGEARFARNSVLDLAGGAFLPEATDEPLLKAAKGENAFALEAIVTPTAASSQPTPQSPTDSAGGGSILSYAPETTSPVTPNFVLGQSGNWLTLRLKTDGAAPAAGAAASPASPSALKLVPITPGQSYHIVVSYGKSGLACYINGKRALISGADGLTGGLGAWTPARLVFGDEWTGGRNWPGFLEGVGLFGREISAGEARARFQDQASKRIGRKPGVDRAVVQARLVAPCDPADPSAIAPYLRCLSVQQYEVVKVLEGKVADKKISVAQWSVLGGKVLPSYATYKQGDTYRLVLERWADRPELEGERLIAGNFTEEGDMYYQEREVLPVASASPDAAPSPLQITEADSTAGRDITIEAAKIPQLVVKGNVRLGGNTTAPGGRLSSVSVIDGGAGYVKAPIITITGGGGSGAKAEALLSVGSFDLPRVGTGYKTAPRVIISEPDIAGGIQAVARAEIAPVGGTIVRVLVLHPGSGYTQAPVVKLEGGDGTGAQVRANMEVNSIFVTQGGSGYTTPPAIILKGDAAQDAIAMAALQTTTLQCTGTRSQFRMEVAGDLTQDGAALVSAWTPDLSQMSSASMDGRTFSVPTGSSWTLQNASTMRFLSPAGRTTPPAPATNAGRLRVLGDSRLGVQDLLTSGEVELGNGAVIGQPEYTANDATITNTGRFLVSGGTEKHPACFGLPSEQQMRYGKRTLINGDASGKAAFTLGNGKNPAAFRIMGADQINVLNGPQSAMDLNAGSVLSLTASTFGSQDRAAKVANAGLLTFAGKLIVQGNHTGFVGIENKGNLVLKGDGMIIERLPHANGPGGYFDFNNNPAQIVNTEGATITGSGRLRYINSTGSEQANSLRIRNMGVLQPTGTLTLENTNLHIGSPEKAGSLQILISGPAAKPGSCTSVHLLRGSGNLEPVALNHAKVNDNPGILSITPNVANTLRIRTATGVAPRGTYRILSAVQLTGTFAEVEYNGQQVIEGNPAAPFKISYQPDGLEVTFP